MKLDINQFQTKKELFEHLKSNKSDFIESKKSSKKRSEPTIYSNSESISAEKSAGSDDNGVIRVKVVANSTFVLDHDMDVLIKGCYDDTITERKSITPHLHDHVQSLDAKVGEVSNIYTEEVSAKDLSFNSEGSTECLIFETDIMKSYNEKIFNQYKSGKINQHSIGLNYEKIDLAINDEDSPEEKAVYDKYIGKILNPKKAIEQGFFWAVEKIMLIENSSVLFGSNHATPTLSAEPKCAVVESEKEITLDNKVKRLRIIQEQIKI